jgi:TonB family protein
MSVFALVKRIVPFLVTFSIGVFTAGLFVVPMLKPPCNGLGSGSGSGGGIGSESSTSTCSLPATNGPVCIISKPRAAYTDGARTNNIEGHVTLRVTFLADGTVGTVQVTDSLPYGLTENAIQAAKSIKFRPKMVDGQPVNTAMTFQYGFNIY